MSNDPAALKLILSDISAAVRRAYAEGYRVGTRDAAEKMTRALAADDCDTPGGDLAIPQVLRAASIRQGGGVLPDRRNGYGSLITSIRSAILAAPDVGLTKEDLTEFAERRGVSVNPNNFKDTIKRLISGDEIKRRHLAYFRGAKLRTDLIPLDTPGIDHEAAEENPAATTDQRH